MHSRNGATQRTTLYFNSGASLFYEEETSGGTTKKKHYLNTPAGTIGVLTQTGSTWSTQYWHKDHLGSPMVITNQTGAVQERLAYEPFGKRRNSNGTTDAAGTLASASTRRGFTGHEHDDEVGLVNMNGRLYDQAIGRFVSPDPTLQAPTYQQSYNRYAYLWNSPLNGTDPSGYTNFFSTLDHLGNRLLPVMLTSSGDPLSGYLVWSGLTSRYGFQAKSIGIAIVSGYCGGAYMVCAGVGQAALAKAYGASDSDAVNAGVRAAATAYAMNAVGEMTGNADGSEMSAGQKIANTAGHAAVGCVSAQQSGGSCRSGALAGGFSAAMTNGPGLSDDMYIATAQSAIYGGVGAMLGGGKFANGAVTGAFGYLFNANRHRALTGSGHHIIPNEVVSTLGITSEAAIAELDSPNARIPVEAHNGSRPSPNTISHAEYNKLALGEADRYMKANNIDPAKMTSEEAKSMVRYFKTEASTPIRQFNTVQYSRALQQAIRRAWYRTPIKAEE